ncbi:MAG: DUF4864 domain-containing protein [Betaproteobacteria bacterium]|nr:DUF4864 domain-containing protein [Betaproteobacteria bacterium]
MKIIRFASFRAFLVALLVFASAGASAATAAKPDKLSASDRQKIQLVITLQIKAFERNDETRAFSYSTPEIRKYFGSSRTFMEMVRANYSVLYMNTSREFLEAAIIDGEVIQPLRIITRDGEAVVALYTLQKQADKEWRIGGCEIAPSTLQAT